MIFSDIKINRNKSYVKFKIRDISIVSLLYIIKSGIKIEDVCCGMDVRINFSDLCYYSKQLALPMMDFPDYQDFVLKCKKIWEKVDIKR